MPTRLKRRGGYVVAARSRDPTCPYTPNTTHASPRTQCPGAQAAAPPPVMRSISGSKTTASTPEHWVRLDTKTGRDKECERHCRARPPTTQHVSSRTRCPRAQAAAPPPVTHSISGSKPKASTNELCVRLDTSIGTMGVRGNATRTPARLHRTCAGHAHPSAALGRLPAAGQEVIR